MRLGIILKILPVRTLSNFPVHVLVMRKAAPW